LRILNAGYTPKINFEDHINSVELLLNKTTVRIVYANKSLEFGLDLNFNNVEEYQRYNKEYNKFSNEIMKREYLSEYHPQVLKIEDEYRIRPISGCFEYTSKMLTGVDENSAYPHSLSMIDKIPVYNYFDVYQPYDNHAIEDYTCYLIEVLENTNRASIMFHEKFTRTYGYALKMIDIKYKIISYKRTIEIRRCKF